ncbi:hypothetical protein LSAT2_025434 [Lamellibrachia satsuma]|nr:hypothetical protein LSAT2_025434 [Lamellibrachia satsuma]
MSTAAVPGAATDRMYVWLVHSGHRVSWKTVYGIISGVAFLVVIVVIVLLILKCYHKTDKPLPISPPARVRIPSESQQEEEMNDNHHYISNNNVSADDQTNLILQSGSNRSEELVDSDETGISLGDIQPYVKAGVSGVTSGTSTGSSFTDDDCINPKERPKCSTAETLSVGDCNSSDQLELVNEGTCLGDIPPHVQASGHRVTDGASSGDSVVESDCVSVEQCSVIQVSSISDQLSTDQSIIGDGSSEGMPTTICNGIAGAASGGSLGTEAESNNVDKHPELHMAKLMVPSLDMRAVPSFDHSNVDPVLSGKQRNCDVEGTIRTLAGSSADDECYESDSEPNYSRIGCCKEDDSVTDSSTMSSGGLYCWGNKQEFQMCEPEGLAASINANSP